MPFTHLGNWEIDHWRDPETTQDRITKTSVSGEHTDIFKRGRQFYFCYGKVIKDRNAKNSLKGDNEWARERVRTHTRWPGYLTCHQPDNNIKTTIRPPITTYTNNNIIWTPTVSWCPDMWSVLPQNTDAVFWCDTHNKTFILIVMVSCLEKQSS